VGANLEAQGGATPIGAPFVGPPSVPLLGWRFRALQLLRDPAKFFLSLYERYGEVSAWDPKDPRHLFVASGRYIKLLLSDPETFTVDGFKVMKLPPGSAMANLTRGLLSINGVEHHYHRKLLAPAFRRHRFTHHTQAITAAIRAELDQWRIGEYRRIDSDLMRLVTFISIRTMFGVTDPQRLERLYRAITTLLAHAASMASLVLPFNIPGSSYARMLCAADVVQREIRLLIEEKRRVGATGEDVLSVLVATHDQEGGRLPDSALIGDAYTVLCHSTVGSALQWTFVLLDQYRAVRDELVEEIHSVVKGDAPTLEELARLERLDRLLKESMRLFPPSSMSVRYAERDCALGPYTVAKGSAIYFSHFVTHRMASVFPQPLKFNPDRWRAEHEPGPYDYAPFGAGPHICIAKHFATEEMKIMLAMILKRLQLSLPPDTRIDRGMRIAMVPKNGLTMRIDRLGARVERTRLVGNVRESVELE
jgi:cytochrome P450